MFNLIGSICQMINMDKDTLLFLLKGGHIDMPTRISERIWLHPPISLSECINLVLDFLKLNKYFPIPWVERKDGELIGDSMIIEKVNENKFICKYRYSNPVNLLRISEAGEKVFNSGYEAVKYYLQHELHLPGDLDGWKVIDDNFNAGSV